MSFSLACQKPIMSLYLLISFKCFEKIKIRTRSIDTVFTQVFYANQMIKKEKEKMVLFMVSLVQ
jgi:hypothetical protein